MTNPPNKMAIINPNSFYSKQSREKETCRKEMQINLKNPHSFVLMDEQQNTHISFPLQISAFHFSVEVNRKQQQDE